MDKQDILLLHQIAKALLASSKELRGISSALFLVACAILGAAFIIALV